MGYCEEAFAKLMAMGVILLGANSDAGASGDYMCFVDGVVGNSLLAPNYPATSPYVTSVGATMDVRMSEGSEPVVAACMAPMGLGLLVAGDSRQSTTGLLGKRMRCRNIWRWITRISHISRETQAWGRFEPLLQAAELRT